MSRYINKIKKQSIKFIKISNNILVNASKEVFSCSKFKKIKKIIDDNKFVIIISSIITLFIVKNFYTIFSYNTEIEKASKEVEIQRSINTQLKEDLEYYKTDEFILRYALEELNLRPTKELDIYHGPILPYNNKEEVNNKNTDTVDENIEDNNKDTLEKDESNTSKDDQE